LNSFLYNICLVSFLHRAVCFEITLYLSSHLTHFSYSSAAFCIIAQAGGGGPGQGELLCHCVVLCGVVCSDFFVRCCYFHFHVITVNFYVYSCIHRCGYNNHISQE
jgi:hypothetical protein